MSGYKSVNCRSNGFTLIELIAVIAILSIAMSIVSLNFATPLRKARTNNAAEIWQNIDQFARELSHRQNIALVLSKSENGMRVVLKDANDGLLREWLLRSPVTTSITTTEGQDVSQIVFNRNSGTIDYQCKFREAQVVKSLEFAGGTGYVRSSK